MANNGLVVLQTPNPGITGVFSASSGLDGTSTSSTAVIGYIQTGGVSFIPLFAFAKLSWNGGTVTVGPTIEIGFAVTPNEIVAGTVLNHTSNGGVTPLVLATPIPSFPVGSPSFFTTSVSVARTGTSTQVFVEVYLIGIYA